MKSEKVEASGFFFFDRDKANTNRADGYDSVGAGELINGVVEMRRDETRDLNVI